MSFCAAGIFGICVSLAGCGHARRTLIVEFTNELAESSRAERKASRPATLELARVDGDRALGTLEYVGGCGSHSFRIVADSFLEYMGPGPTGATVTQR